MSIDPQEAFGRGVNGLELSEISPPVYEMGFTVDNCVEAFTDPDDGIEYGDTSFTYGLYVQFETYEDMEAFRQHPEFSEMRDTMIRHMQENGKEDLQLELSRDQNPFYTEEERGPNSFTQGTLDDLQVSVDDIIKQVNGAYNVNIRNGYVAEESTQVDFCIPSYIGPNEFAAADGIAGGMGMGNKTN